MNVEIMRVLLNIVIGISGISIVRKVIDFVMIAKGTEAYHLFYTLAKIFSIMAHAFIIVVAAILLSNI